MRYLPGIGPRPSGQLMVRTDRCIVWHPETLAVVARGPTSGAQATNEEGANQADPDYRHTSMQSDGPFASRQERSSPSRWQRSTHWVWPPGASLTPVAARLVRRDGIDRGVSTGIDGLQKVASPAFMQGP